jgi:hypothetical protein
VNIAEEVAQFQGKSFRIFDFESEVVAGQGVAIFGARKMGAEKCFFADGKTGTPRALASWGDYC